MNLLLDTTVYSQRPRHIDEHCGAHVERTLPKGMGSVTVFRQDRPPHVGHTAMNLLLDLRVLVVQAETAKPVTSTGDDLPLYGRGHFRDNTRSDVGGMTWLDDIDHRWSAWQR